MEISKPLDKNQRPKRGGRPCGNDKGASTPKTGQLSILMARKPVHGMWTPLSLGHEKIIPLNSAVIIVNDSAQQISSIIRRSWNPFYFQLNVVKQAHRENA